ncbi:MAG: hypothetical protein LKJ25_10040 [Clostridia bacterium]|jgi:hypothetical protein|nr:hypothetical protein [Clostridia bacterium]
MTEADEFKTELLENCAKAEKEYGCLQKKLLSDIDRYGAVETIKEIIRKNRVSDGFYALKKAGHLELSAETLVTEKKYGGLFSDSDVNYCLQVLCENGFYN